MINPVRDKFYTAKKLSSWRLAITKISSVVVLFAFILSKLGSEHLEQIQLIVDWLGFLTIVVVAVLSLAGSFVHMGAEDDRRKMAIDNAFDKQFGENKSTDYYTNDGINDGVERLFANYFESCFFTNKIALSMLKKLSVKSILLLLPFIAAILLRDNQLLFLLADLAIVSLILSRWIRTAILVKKTKSILERFRGFYCSKKNMDSKTKKGSELLMILDYEAAVTWAHVLLSEKVYEKERDNLGKQWDEMKLQYQIS